MLEKTSIS